MLGVRVKVGFLGTGVLAPYPFGIGNPVMAVRADILRLAVGGVVGHEALGVGAAVAPEVGTVVKLAATALEHRDFHFRIELDAAADEVATDRTWRYRLAFSRASLMRFEERRLTILSWQTGSPGNFGRS